ncbi:MAG: class I SAM-dependent methyltransferase [Lachnospiraceae bacterium]|nr:class I SAM-dependent methyltransferase [Lachnospiraceae bacterium]
MGHGLPVVLDTDAELKKAKYEHLGMKCATAKHLADGVELYGMVYEPESIPKEWRSEAVLNDYRILNGKNASIWDKFATVYSGFVTGTPGNKKAYDDESFDMVIIANALHVIPEPEKALSEIMRVLKKDGTLIAPNFIHDNRNKVSGAFSKALSVAGVVFEAKWNGEGYISFLENNGFSVKNSKQLASTIPMVYAECVKDDIIDAMKAAKEEDIPLYDLARD